MDALHRIIIKNHGVLEKFMGDGVLAYFPEFFSGQDAGFHAATAAEECHSEMEKLYKAHRSAFRAVLSTGFGIGIDYGQVSFVWLRDGLTVLGASVVYASRLAQGGEAGQTLLNQQAYDAIVGKFGQLFSLSEITVKVKNEEAHLAYVLKRNKRPHRPAAPGWPALAKS